MSKSEEQVTVDFDGQVHETDGAWLLRFGKRDVWLPKAAIEVDWDAGEVTMPEKLAMEKGLI